MSPDVALAVCRFVHDGALMALWGCFGYLAVLVPEPLRGLVAGRLTGFRLTAAALSLAATIVALPVHTALIGNGWPDAANAATIADVLTSTSIGASWLAQLFGALAVAAAQFCPAPWRAAATAGTAALALATLATGGHAVMQDGWQHIVQPLNDMLHVLSAGAWFGALLPLLLVLKSFARTKSADMQAEAVAALRRFSTAGHWAVALAILSGIGNGIFIVGWPATWTSTYLLLLAAKMAVVLAMTAVAIINRYHFVPLIGRERQSAIAAITAGTMIEIGLGFSAIGLVAVFGMLDPAGMQ